MQVREQIKGELDRAADFLVRIKNDLARGVVEESDRETKSELALLGFGQFAAQQSLVHPMQFGFAHLAFEAEEQTIVVMAWVVDSFFIDDQSVGQGADFEQLIPVATGTG